MCPTKIGLFERDAVGERDPKASADFCSYSALDGVYGTIVITPLSGPYDPKTSLVPEFQEQEATGGKVIGEASQKFGGASVYTRSYGTSTLGDVHYRVMFAASAVGQWAVQATMEYASPRDDAVKQDFLNAVYDEALHKLGDAKIARRSRLPLLIVERRAYADPFDALVDILSRQDRAPRR